MKKTVIMTILSIIVLVVAVVSFYYATYNEYAIKLPFKIGDGKVIAIYYAGGLEGEYNYETLTKYVDVDVNTLKKFDLGGSERYVIFPKYNYSKINIYSLEYDEDGNGNKTFVEAVSDPFVIDCNESDIMPNSFLKITMGDKKYEYSPCISLKDGSLVLEKFVVEIK